MEKKSVWYEENLKDKFKTINKIKRPKINLAHSSNNISIHAHFNNVNISQNTIYTRMTMKGPPWHENIEEQINLWHAMVLTRLLSLSQLQPIYKSHANCDIA